MDRVAEVSRTRVPGRRQAAAWSRSGSWRRAGMERRGQMAVAQMAVARLHYTTLDQIAVVMAQGGILPKGGGDEAKRNAATVSAVSRARNERATGGGRGAAAPQRRQGGTPLIRRMGEEDA